MTWKKRWLCLKLLNSAFFIEACCECRCLVDTSAGERSQSERVWAKEETINWFREIIKSFKLFSDFKPSVHKTILGQS